MLKELLPTVLNSHYISSVCRLPVLEEKVGEARRERDKMAGEWKKVLRQYDTLLADYEQERKEVFTVKVRSSSFALFRYRGHNSNGGCNAVPVQMWVVD